MVKPITFIFISLFCEKNSDGTKNLRLKGKDLYQRIGKRLDKEDMKQVGLYLATHPEIVKLDLCYNTIGNKGLYQLFNNCISVNIQLNYLNLMHCKISNEGLKYLTEIIDRIELKTLRLTGNKLRTMGGMYVCKIMELCPTLEHLDVGDCELTMGGLMHVLTPLQNNVGAPALKVIDLSRPIPDSEMYQYPPAHMAESVGLIMRTNNTLRELHMQKCEFDGHDVELLLIGLKANQSLLMLDLGYNRFGDMGIELIAEWLRTRPPLLGLNVAGNQISNTGARALSFHMPFSKIRMLDITFNKIGDSGIADILHSIKKPYILRVLFIWGNKLGSESREIIERMVEAGVLIQEQIDVKIYTVDDVRYHAFYPADHYKHRYYCVMDHGCPIELRIRRNIVEPSYSQPRPKVYFQFYDRIPGFDPSLPPNDPC